MSSISKPAAPRFCSRPASCRWKASSRRSSARPIARPVRGLDQGQVPRRTRVVLGGWKTTNGKFRSLMAGVNRGDHLAFVGMVGTGFGQDKVKAHHAGAKGRGLRQEPVRRKNAPRKTRTCIGWSPGLSLKSNLQALPMPETSGRLRSRGYARTSPPGRWRRKSRP